MTKYIKQRLSVKIFIITFFLLGAACGGTYFFISKLLPVTYSNLINVSTEKAAMHLVEQMTAFDNISDCENDISNFSKETNAAFWIEDSNGRMIYPAEASMETSTTSADCTVTFDEDESFIDMQPSGETTTNFYPFTLKNGTAYALAVQTDLFVVQQATKVLLSILPYVILMVFLLSLLCAWLYTRYITTYASYASALASDTPKVSTYETVNTSGKDILYQDTVGGQISVDGKNWVDEADYEKNNAAPDVQWWTADEYEAWMNEQKKEMESLIGTGDGWYDGEGVFHEFTQESVAAMMDSYKGTLESIKKGVLYSKDNGDGDTYSMIPPTEDVVSSYSVDVTKDNGKTVHIGDYSTVEELDKAISDAVKNGQLTQEEADAVHQ